VTSRLQADDEEAAEEQLHNLGCTDGLPVTVPTEARVRAFLAAHPGLPPGEVLGTVPPRMGQATVESVAVNAIMAGCPAPTFPVLCAAVRAVCDPAFTLDVVQGTTHNAAVLIIVNGSGRLPPPALASGSGSLGPGHRANATIGRALRLVLINAGGGRPGIGDMSTLGQPAKFTCCVAEAEDDSPFAPLSSFRGVPKGSPAVTVLAVEGPRQVMFVPVGGSVGADAGRLVELLGLMIASPGSLAGMGYRGSAAVLLSPLHARVLADAGYHREDVTAAVFEAATNEAGAIRRWHGFVRGPQLEYADHEAVHALSSRDHLLIAVAGGPGTYSAVFCGLAEGIGEAVTVAC
jgi:hypothetical protein